MVYTDADLATIRAHIVSGVLEVRFADGRTVKHHSLDELLKAEQHIIGFLTAASPTARPRRRTAAYRNGC